MTVSVRLIKKVIRDKFPKIRKLSLEFVSVNLSCVILGIKPSFLVERIPFHSQSSSEFKLNILCQIASEINKEICKGNTYEDFSTQGALGVFGVLTTDFLFYNKHNLHKSLRERFVDVDYLIDISSNLSEPKVVSYCPTTTDLISNLLEQIQHNKDSDGFQLACLNSWNISTLFGVLLDYPVIYFYKGLPEEGSCIDHKDLISYKVSTTIDECQSEIYCFSCPQSLESCISGKISVWIEQLVQKNTDINFVWSKEIVNLDCVVL